MPRIRYSHLKTISPQRYPNADLRAQKAATPQPVEKLGSTNVVESKHLNGQTNYQEARERNGCQTKRIQIRLKLHSS
eukprot:scaffold1808_cov360-Prasinococcus_capsulatus_cf.AAC.3